ncbi:MAG: histidinol-phosphatase HisJ family protein [Acidimicrobiia bacterium]|nr:histidinol-phosphatase HisJ family protein [Acidimicrobiia bacterium]NNL71302.1 histidinol-phosphatase HisJ family protein [Acidimicrobiia bacterium]
MGDYHLHLHRHGRAHELDPPPGVYPAGHIEAYVEAAAARGVHELGFTEHLYRCEDAAGVLGRFWEREPVAWLADQTERFLAEDRTLNLERYVETIVDAQERGLPVLLGLEVDFFPETIDAVVEFLAPYPWDFLIGSVHWVGGWAIDHEDAVAAFDERGVDRAYEQFFALEAQLAASGAVDALAHVDVVKKHGHRPPRERTDLYDEVVTAAAGSGVAVEVSSGGLRNPAAEVYPAPALLSRFYDAGVPITLASDGHSPHQAAWGRDEVVAAARAAGYTERSQFRKRRRTQVPIESRPEGPSDLEAGGDGGAGRPAATVDDIGPEGDGEHGEHYQQRDDR